MRRVRNPKFRYDWRAALWATATATVLGAVAILVVGRPPLVIPVGFVAGVVAASRGGFYSPHANNGFVGVLIALGPLYVVGFLHRARQLPAELGEANVTFLAAATALLDLVFLSVPMLALAYLGGIAGDAVRRRVGGHLGY